MLAGSSTPKLEQEVKTDTPAAASSSQAEPAAKPKINITKTATPPVGPENPFNKLPSRTSGSEGTAAVRSQSAINPLKRSAEADSQNIPRPAPRKPAQAPSEETIEDYENSEYPHCGGDDGKEIFTYIRDLVLLRHAHSGAGV